ncbi:MAG: hypothetical protein WCO98_11675 [bacterium]
MTTNYTQNEQTCYRHPDRITAVSCGKCGKPLCPDCINHGPVGIRCIDCLRPSNGRVTGMHAPVAVDQARWVTLILVIIFAGIIGKISSIIPIINFSETLKASISIPGPNLFISMIAGFIVGYIIWRIVGKTWNYSTLWLAIISGVAIPIAGTILSILLSHNAAAIFTTLTGNNMQILHLCIRTTIASLLSGGLAALMATNPRNIGL